MYCSALCTRDTELHNMKYLHLRNSQTSGEDKIQVKHEVVIGLSHRVWENPKLVIPYPSGKGIDKPNSERILGTVMLD